MFLLGRQNVQLKRLQLHNRAPFALTLEIYSLDILVGKSQNANPRILSRTCLPPLALRSSCTLFPNSLRGLARPNPKKTGCKLIENLVHLLACFCLGRKEDKKERTAEVWHNQHLYLHFTVTVKNRKRAQEFRFLTLPAKPRKTAC